MLGIKRLIVTLSIIGAVIVILKFLQVSEVAMACAYLVGCTIIFFMVKVYFFKS